MFKLSEKHDRKTKKLLDEEEENGKRSDGE